MPRPWGPSAAGRPAAGPRLRLIAVQHRIDIPKYGKQVVVDPGIWVGALGRALRIDAGRASYTRPVTLSQVITTASGATRTRRMPGWMNAGSGRLRDFGRVTVRDSRGRVVGSHTFNFCPDTNFPERTGPDSAAKSSFPSGCYEELFQLGMVSGIARGWAVDPALQSFQGQSPFLFKLPLGTYHVTETIQPGYARFFGIPARDATATVIGHVVKGTPGGFRPARRRPAPARRREAGPLPSLPRDVPLLRHVPANALPDLVPLPSWDITTSHVTQDQPGLPRLRRDRLGRRPLAPRRRGLPHARLVHHAGLPVLLARRAHRRPHPGRAPCASTTRRATITGTSSSSPSTCCSTPARRSRCAAEKVGFCIGPTDAIDLLCRTPPGSPGSIGLTGLCGPPTALWVQE